MFAPTFRRVFLVNLLSDVSLALFLHFPGFLAVLNAGETMIGTITAVAVMVSVVVRPGVGQIVDRVGHVRILTVAATLRAASVLSLVLITEIGLPVFVARTGYAVGSTVLYAGLFSYASVVVPTSRRTQGLAIFGISSMVALMFGPALGDLVIQLGGFTGLFQVIGMLDLIGVAAIRWLKPIPSKSSSSRRLEFFNLVMDSKLRGVWVLTLTFGLFLGTIWTFIRTYIDDLGIGTVGLFFLAYAGTAVFLRLTLAWLPDRCGYRAVLYPSLLATTAGVLFLAATNSHSTLIVAAMLMGTGHAFIFPIVGKLLVERGPRERRSASVGVYMGMFDLSILLAGPLLGVLIEMRGYSMMFVVLAATIVWGVVVFAKLDTRQGVGA